MPKNLILLLMKKSILLFIFFAFAKTLCGQSVTVHLGNGTSLKSQLVTYDKISEIVMTGTPSSDDYAYMGSKDFFSKAWELKLDMRDADVDTIPTNAINVFQLTHLVLPKKLVFISDTAFINSPMIVSTLEVTGRFPGMGQTIFGNIDMPSYRNDYFSISEDNEYCVEDSNGIYSVDGKTFYAVSSSSEPNGCEQKYVLKEGTDIIGGNAFSYCQLAELTIPESIDSIGDYAFEFVLPTDPLCPSGINTNIFCNPKEPPLLGNGVFSNIKEESRFFIYVPDESLALYKNAKGWSELPFKIKSFSEFYHQQGIEGTLLDSEIKIEYKNNAFVSTHVDAVMMQVFDIDGSMVGESTFVGGCAKIFAEVSSGVYIYRIEQANGTKVVGKCTVEKK